MATRYAIPADGDAKGIRRYGFHGISYADLVRVCPRSPARHLPDRLLALHLGNGASLCAIQQGRSVATTMGYSPLAGLTMGTRSGDIDGNAVLRLVEDHGAEARREILNHESGLLALGGASDMRALHAAGTPAGPLCHRPFRLLGHPPRRLDDRRDGRADALAFTGGIGENDADDPRRDHDRPGLTGVAFDAQANAQNAPRLHTSPNVAAWVVPARRRGPHRRRHPRRPARERPRMNQPLLDTSPHVSDEIRKTTCYMCACRCGINVHLKSGKRQLYRGQPRPPGEQGRAVRQGRGGHQAGHRPVRLRAPLKRVGPRGSGEFEEITWDEALETGGGLAGAAAR